MRASSGALMLALGLAILALRPRSARGWAIAAHLIAFGPGFVALNLPLGATGSLIGGVSHVLGLLALAILARIEVADGARARWIWLGLLCGLVPIAMALRAFTSTGEATIGGWMSVVGGFPLFGLAGGLAAAVAERASRAQRRTAAGELLAVAGLGAYPLVYFATQAAGGDSWLALVGFIGLLPFLAAIFFFARAARGGAPRLGPALAIAFPSVAALLAFVTLRPYDPGAWGIARIVGAGLIAYAVFGLDLFETRMRTSTSRTGVATSAFVVVLLIVAQVAQEFLSAQYGLLMGGLVAGALLVAARPIERALEDRGPRRVPIGAPEDEVSTTYRAALRRYLRDGSLSRDEEIELSRLARHLGIPHEVATRLRHEVEDELRGSAR